MTCTFWHKVITSHGKFITNLCKVGQNGSSLLMHWFTLKVNLIQTLSSSPPFTKIGQIWSAYVQFIVKSPGTLNNSWPRLLLVEDGLSLKLLHYLLVLSSVLGYSVQVCNSLKIKKEGVSIPDCIHLWSKVWALVVHNFMYSVCICAVKLSTSEIVTLS